MAHECPDCGSDCYCDGEDVWVDEYPECKCACEEEDEDWDDADYR